MYKENALEYIPLLQALADGELQQRAVMGGWEDVTGNCEFEDGPKWYRRKPKIRMYWYRVAKMKSSYPYVDTASNSNEEVALMDHKDFVEWITERIDYEVLPC